LNIMNSDDFSTNMHLAARVSIEAPSRHPDLCFSDGNIAILAGGCYFLVHEGFICRHSQVLDKLAKRLEQSQSILVEGRKVLQLDDSPEAIVNFLHALYDGMWVLVPTMLQVHMWLLIGAIISSSLPWDGMKFSVVSELLRLLTKYQVNHLRTEVLQRLSSAWPSTLALWDLRETKATNSAGLYSPRETLPHPMCVLR
jgi:hypothetical protein